MPGSVRAGFLLASAPGTQAFERGIRAMADARAQGWAVYVYLLDEAVRAVHGEGAGDRFAGAHLFACAYGARKRDLPLVGAVIFAGLGTLADLMAGCDRFEVYS